jgi:hypothetical protein
MPITEFDVEEKGENKESFISFKDLKVLVESAFKASKYKSRRFSMLD